MIFHRYDVNRIILFDILSHFDFQLLYAGSLFVVGWISDDDAEKINQKWPNAAKRMK